MIPWERPIDLYIQVCSSDLEEHPVGEHPVMRCTHQDLEIARPAMGDRGRVSRYRLCGILIVHGDDTINQGPASKSDPLIKAAQAMWRSWLHRKPTLKRHLSEIN